MKFACAAFAAAGFLLFSATVAEGCGDKLVSFLSGVRYQRAYLASRQASVVLFSNNRASGGVLTNSKLLATLKEVGHSVIVVQDSTQFDLALRAGKVDVVLADSADADSLARELASASSQPVIVRVLYKPSKADFTAAQKQFQFVVKAPGDEIQFLTAIDAAMKSRAKAAGKS